MPESMISAEAGGSPNVNGSNMATVVNGEMPGRTPTRVPMATPIRQNARFAGVAAVAKPIARLLKSSMTGSPGPKLQRQPKPPDEQERRKCRNDGPEG